MEKGHSFRRISYLNPIEEEPLEPQESPASSVVTPPIETSSIYSHRKESYKEVPDLEHLVKGGSEIDSKSSSSSKKSLPCIWRRNRKTLEIVMPDSHDGNSDPKPYLVRPQQTRNDGNHKIGLGQNSFQRSNSFSPHTQRNKNSLTRHNSCTSHIQRPNKANELSRNNSWGKTFKNSILRHNSCSALTQTKNRIHQNESSNASFQPLLLNKSTSGISQHVERGFFKAKPEAKIWKQLSEESIVLPDFQPLLIRKPLKNNLTVNEEIAKYKEMKMASKVIDLKKKLNPLRRPKSCPNVNTENLIVPDFMPGFYPPNVEYRIFSKMEETAVYKAENGQFIKSFGIYDKMLEFLKALLGNDHPKVANTNYHIGLLFKKMSMLDKALSYFEEGAKILYPEPKNWNNDLSSIFYQIALIYEKKNDEEAAIYHFDVAQQIEQRIFGKPKEETRTKIANLLAAKK